MKEGHAHTTPAPLNRREDVRLIGYKCGLLFARQFKDPAAFFLGGEGGEDAVVEAEVGMAHVSAFDGIGEREGEAAKESYLWIACGSGHRDPFRLRGTRPLCSIWQNPLFATG